MSKTVLKLGGLLIGMAGILFLRQKVQLALPDYSVSGKLTGFDVQKQAMRLRLTFTLDENFKLPGLVIGQQIPIPAIKVFDSQDNLLASNIDDNREPSSFTIQNPLVIKEDFEIPITGKAFINVIATAGKNLRNIIADLLSGNNSNGITIGATLVAKLQFSQVPIINKQVFTFQFSV